MGISDVVVITEAARERLVSVVHADRWDRALSSRQLADRIIAALVGIAPETSMRKDDDHGIDIDGRCDVCDSSSPVVDFGPDELRWLADVVEQYEQLYNTTFKVADHDAVQSIWPVAMPYAGLPVRVVCGENCWVLRVGGEDD